MSTLAVEFGHNDVVRRNRRRSWIVLFQLAGLFVLTVAIRLSRGFIVAIVPAGPIVNVLLVGPLAVFLGLKARESWLLLRRLRAPTGHQLMARDRRRPVLYLRAFDDDLMIGVDERENLLPLNSLIRRLPEPILYITGLQGFVDSTNVVRYEKHLYGVLRKYGPAVAVAAPLDVEAVPPLGIARFYCDPNRWQAEVAQLIRQARIIIVAMNDSPGLRWEIGEMLRVVDPRRVILLFPTADRYAAVKPEAEPLFPRRLPEHPAPIVTFDSDWTPVPIGPEFMAAGEIVAPSLSLFGAGFESSPIMAHPYLAPWVADILRLGPPILPVPQEDRVPLLQKEPRPRLSRLANLSQLHRAYLVAGIILLVVFVTLLG